MNIKKLMRILLLIFTSLLLNSFVLCMAQMKVAIDHLNYTNEINEQIRFVYSDTSDNIFLRKIREENKLPELIKNCQTDMDKLYSILNWASKQWAHSGDNIPSANDALTILREAREGNRFRCVEYGIVLCAALNSIGLKARVMGLKTKAVETSQYGAGHVIAEVFIKEHNKWVYADAQFNLVPLLDKIPLNAVELQNCIADGNKIIFSDLNGPVKKMTEFIYLSFIPKYLYYFDVSFDNRQELSIDKLRIDDKTKLMLVPVGAKNPEIFQVTEKINYCLYTNSIKDFYKIP